jgi:hypothetical protein
VYGKEFVAATANVQQHQQLRISFSQQQQAPEQKDTLQTKKGGSFLKCMKS